jgi:hypothetical protein
MGTDLEILRPRGRGRPTLYNAAYCDRVLELAAEGCCKAEIAAALHVSVKTLTAWTKAHEEFRDAMIRAKELEYAWWLAAGRKGQFMRTWNASGWALQMRNRFRKRFRDKPPPLREENPEDSVNAEQLRDEMERKLSRIADAGAESGLPLATDGKGAEKPPI